MQVILGSIAVIILYQILVRVFGRIAAIVGASVLAVIPSSVIIDSSNEPDASLSFILLLAAGAIVIAVRNRRDRWLYVFAVLMGIGFNTKMLVAFVPLPVFFLYYLVSSKYELIPSLKRLTIVTFVIIAVSLSWVIVVSLVPDEHRPYVGSTQDNSIWTLAFGYNGVDRFTSFIGPRTRLATPDSQDMNRQFPMNIQQLPLGHPPLRVGQLGVPFPYQSDQTSSGPLQFFEHRFALQLGWLLPLGLTLTGFAVAIFLSKHSHRRPMAFLRLIRFSPIVSEGILWGGWLLTGVVVFGLASATTTHPYYLAGLSVPLAAVIGIGTSLIWRIYGRGGKLSCLILTILAVNAAYIIQGGRGSLSSWAIAGILVVVCLVILAMATVIFAKKINLPLAGKFGSLGVLTILIVPMWGAIAADGRMVGAGSLNGDLALSSVQNFKEELAFRVLSFIRAENQGNSIPPIATMSSREAAPYIIEGIPAVAIGGFSGRDPVFDLSSFLRMVNREHVKYFLVPAQNRSPVLNSRFRVLSQANIITYVVNTWEDVSVLAGLPENTLYRYDAY
jgi:4-amino-4-deoxy-L-arabinose transferase-like glycosyltransferase